MPLRGLSAAPWALRTGVTAHCHVITQCHLNGRPICPTLERQDTGCRSDSHRCLVWGVTSLGQETVVICIMEPVPLFSLGPCKSQQTFYILT